MFMFNFNLIGTHEEEEVTYTFNKTCSPSLPWSDREVICEVNYMEVSWFTTFSEKWKCVCVLNSFNDPGFSYNTGEREK